MKWRTLKGPRESRGAALRRLAPHHILGVAASAAADEIRSAYKRLARIYHPDCVHPFLRPHSEEMMKLLNSAYRSMMSRFER